MGDFLYAIPLIIAVSLVYSATRFEELGPIVRHALRTGVSLVLLMLLVFAGLQAMEWALG